MLNRQAFTLFEIIIVLIIIGVCTVLVLPNFTTPTEQARAQGAKNNLLAIYSAQQNYRNNNNGFCTTPICNSLPSINSNLSLNIQDDGSYSYSCASVSGGFACTAIRTGNTLTLQVNNLPISTTNPSCSGTTSWCP